MSRTSMILKVTCAALALAMLAAPAPAAAEKGGHGKPEWSGQGKSKSKKKTAAGTHDMTVGFNLSGHDRSVIKDYLIGKYRGHCPPGLAKKNNGCMPPGQAKKYRIGGVLSDDIIWHALPTGLMARLPQPPGAFYAQVDGDVLLVSEATKKVLDAVTLLSAVQ